MTVLEQELDEAFEAELGQLRFDAALGQLVDQLDQVRDVLPQPQSRNEAANGGHQFKLLDHFHQVGRADRLVELLVEGLQRVGNATALRIVPFVAKEELSVELLMSFGEMPVPEQIS